MKSIWVFIEIRRGKIAPVSLEILGEARRLANQLGGKLVALVLGQNLKEISEEIATFGPDEVIVLEDEALTEASEDNFAQALAELVKRYSPDIILGGATIFGRAMIPRLAAMLETGLTADCLELAIDQESGLLLGSCPGFGGNVMAEIVCPDKRPQMATIRPNVLKSPAPDGSKPCKIFYEKLEKGLISKSEILEFIETEGDAVNLEDAEIIVGCGRGAATEKNFELVKELADLLGASLGATRPLVDNGLVAYQQQIGQTGKTVSPKLYIACGISGAIHHVAGIQSSDCIIAIDKDPDAPIFDVATYGIVGDVAAVLPHLIDEIRRSGRGPA
ncbi:MAG: electron transfer flavoprotein subunit alpha/FixB family protein [Actinomycetota bacterium]|nr:electron transfer flavoprotein subunit alpha/FixB family protein [Actinomycetota bacterium]